VIAGVVLAAGLGTRLRPLTDLVPKPLCPVAGVPLVDLAVARIEPHVDAVAVNVHHHRAQIEAHLEARWPHVHRSVEEPEPLGTAGAHGHLRPWIAGRAVLVHNADAWFGGAGSGRAGHDLTAFVEGWDGERVRLVVVPARHGQAADFPDGTTFAGISLNPWALVERLQPTPTGLWEVAWREEAAAGRLDVVVHDGPWFDTGTPSTYLAANLAANGGASVIAPDAEVDPTACIERSLVWSGASVGPGEHLVEQIRAPGPLTVDAPQHP
jgi:NDP-sugar pyrophosphorylase family protein